MKVAEFKNLCPNCSGTISDERLKLGLPCEKCLPEVPDKLLQVEEICELLGDNLKDFSTICQLEEFSSSFKEFFKSKTGFSPWNLQLSWTKRVSLKKSFTLIAPTGVGKTTWGLVMSSFLPGKVYVIVPTKLLVVQTLEKLKKMTEKRVVGYTGKKKEKEAIFSGDFDILVTTTNFLYTNFEQIPKPFDFVFVDDVDSLLKSAKNVDKVLMLLGFSERAVSLAMESINLKSKLQSSKNREEIFEKLREIEEELKKEREKVKGVIVVASATSQPKSKRVKLFRELLGFEIGRSSASLRNVEDVVVFDFNGLFESAVSIVKKWGKGAFVFVSSEYGKDGVERMKRMLNEEGIVAVSYEEFTPENQEKFVKGEIKAVVGISSYRNPLARGIDLPQSVRYAVFVGVPKMEFSVNLDLVPSKLFSVLFSLRNLLPKEDESKINRYLSYLRKYLGMSEEQVQSYQSVKERLEEIRNYLKSFVEDEKFLEKVKNSDEISLKEEGGSLKIVVGDATGYVQASGRTSRMIAGGLTKGVSIMLVDDYKAFNSLRKRLLVFLEDVNFKVLGNSKTEKFGFELITEKELKEVFKEVDRDREKALLALQGKLSEREKAQVSTSLIVVESPNKARTIAGFFGKPTRRKIKGLDVYEINVGKKLILLTASKGHVFDLTISDGIWGVKEEENFVPVYATIKVCSKCGEQTTEPVCPKCKTPPDSDKMEIIKALREISLEADEILIASDPDTEGEKIGWDVGISVKPYQRNLKRMEFHEITKRAFMEALENPRNVDENLVKAQIVRRIADRWMGFSLSQHLWKTFDKNWLSAGRVQTPVLGWVIERYEKSKEKVGKLTVRTDAGTFTFTVSDKSLKDLSCQKLKLKVVDSLVQEKSPPPPYNTGELLRDADLVLGFSAEKTMAIAQELFEAGFITYHRTDSTRVSSFGIGVARQYISENFPQDFFSPRHWGEGGAHECIRPTRPLDANGLKTSLAVSGASLSITRDHLRLYDLIFRRFIASQMKPLKLKVLKVLLKVIPDEIVEEAELPVSIVEDGWNKVGYIKLSSLSVDLEKGKEYYFDIKEVEKKKVPKVYPFTQGELVEEMRKRGIGRPSTYAKIVQTLLDRRYVVQRGKFLYPTSLGRKVYEYLSTTFPEYSSEDFTRKLEELMDKVERGEENYQEVIKAFTVFLELKEVSQSK